MRSTGIGTDAYVTFDGGRSWTPSRIAPEDSALRHGGDPVVYITSGGTAFLSVLARVDGASKTLISRSVDGGRSWETPSVVAKSDRQWMAFDTSRQSSGIFHGTSYLSGSYLGVIFSRSADGGRSWSPAARFSRDEGGPDPDAPIGGTTADLLITPDGTIAIPFVSSAPGIPVVQNRVGTDPIRASRWRLLVSETGGRNWLGTRDGPVKRDVTPRYRQIRAMASPRAAINTTRGRYRGRIYVVWSDYDDERDRYVVKLGYTSDLGKTWGTTVVTDDVVQHDPSNPALTVNRDGIVAVIWNDRRDDPAGECWRLYGAVSVDGGESFLPNVRMSRAPTCVNAPGNWTLMSRPNLNSWADSLRARPGFVLMATAPVRFPNGGDTQGLVADGAGVFHAAWINGESGVLQLWYTRFAVDPPLVAQVRARDAGQRDAVAQPASDKDDLSHELTFEMSDPQIDFAAQSLRVTMRVVNTGPFAIGGPIDVVLHALLNAPSMGMGLDNLRAANADNGKPHGGATWTFEAGENGILRPGEKTASRVLRFRFDGGVPAVPDGPFEPTFDIYGRRIDVGARSDPTR